jgi:hypothetical protein
MIGALSLVIALAMMFLPMLASAQTGTVHPMLQCEGDGFIVTWTTATATDEVLVVTTHTTSGDEDSTYSLATSGSTSFMDYVGVNGITGYTWQVYSDASMTEAIPSLFDLFNSVNLGSLVECGLPPTTSTTTTTTEATTTTIPDAGFVDVSSGSVFFDDVNYIAYYGVTTGVGGGRFDPLGEVSRWQMALFLDRVWEAVGFALPAPSGSLTDIGDLPAEYQDAIGALAALGVTQGTGDGRFNPDGEVSRWQMALFLVRVLDLAGVTLPSGANQGFSDIGSLDVSYQMAINQLFQLGITTGTSASTFGPDGVVTREQMAAFLARTMRLIQLIQQ